MTSHNSTATRVVSRLMRFTKRSGPVTSVQPRRKFFRTLTKIASISLLCAGFANVALASTVNNKSLPHESMAIQANLQIGVAAKATPTPSIAGNSGVLDFADYIQDRKTKGWSSAVYSKYEKEQVIGKLIIDLSGTIVESGKDTHGFYLALAVKAGDPKIDAYAYIPESDILNFSANQKVRLSGLIFDTWVQNLMIKDVVFSSGGKAPAKTATVTAANATAVPTKASVSGSGTKAKNNSTANANANLRSGPGTNYGVVGAVKKGDALTITGSDATNKWFQLSDGNWVSASLVSNPPGNLSVVSAPPAPVAAATKVPAAVAVVAPTATAPAAAPPPTTIVSAPATAVAAGGQTSFRSGTLRVNVNIAPGRYMTNASSCYWERLKGFSGSLDDIIANDNASGRSIVDIAPSDVGFSSSRCGTWSPFQATSRPTIVDGIWKVNEEIQPGQWQTTSATSCYWERLSSFGGTLDEILANDNSSEASVIVQILPSDTGFNASRCGTWTRIE